MSFTVENGGELTVWMPAGRGIHTVSSDFSLVKVVNPCALRVQSRVEKSEIGAYRGEKSGAHDATKCSETTK